MKTAINRVISMQVWKSLLLSIAIFSAACSYSENNEIKEEPDGYSATVVSITDGDTIRVLTKDKEQIRVRFAGIDCPERKQPWGTRAKESLDTLLSGKKVFVEVVDVDQYERSVARIFVDDVNINRMLVQRGDCWVYPRYAKDQVLFDLQVEAQEAKRGLWKLPEKERVAPWEWRRNN